MASTQNEERVPAAHDCQTVLDLASVTDSLPTQNDITLCNTSPGLCANESTTTTDLSRCQGLSPSPSTESAVSASRKALPNNQNHSPVSRPNQMSGRRQSFLLAVHHQDQELWSLNFELEESTPPTCFQRMVRKVAKEYLVDDRERQYYADNYSCCPPPLFIPAITLIEIGSFIYYTVESGNLHVSPSGPVPATSIFIYRPDRRFQVWRFFLYMLIHAGWVHLFFNMFVQFLVGLPLEMVHGSVRIGLVYMAGVLAGSLGTSVFDTKAFLVGASGGVYALLAAHLANILLNYSEMELGILKLAAVFIVASADVGFAIWDRYTNDEGTPAVGYVAHLMGALAGLTIGLLVLKNFEQRLHAQILWWVALGVYSACTLFAILWNLFHYQ